MRNYLKSLGSFSWAMSLFGLKNLGALLTFSGFRRRGNRSQGASEGLDAATKAVTESLGSVLKMIFHSGDRFVRGLVDLSFGRARRHSVRDAMPWLHTPPPGREADPSASTSAFRPRDPGMAPSVAPTPPQASPLEAPPVSGWGPMPPIPDSAAAATSPGATGASGTTPSPKIAAATAPGATGASGTTSSPKA